MVPHAPRTRSRRLSTIEHHGRSRYAS
jgi:hypothetical protein